MDPNRIKDKNGDTVWDLLTAKDDEIRGLIRKARAEASISKDDIANGESGFYKSTGLAYLASR